MTYHRRPHQKQAITDILSGFERHARGQFISACGTGKTVTCLWVKEDLDAQRTLVLVPSLALIDQYASEWREHQAPELRYATLCVCSDKTVGRNGDDYDAVEFTAEDLARDGFEVTSDAARIAEFMKQPGRRVIFSTYQSLHQIEEAQRDDAVPAFDLAIADEAHRCAGKRDSVFATILDGDRIRASRRLFATATPKIQRKKSGDSELEDVADMSNESMFGKVFHRLTPGSAIRQDILSDYRILITEVSDDGLHETLTSNDDSAKTQRRHSVQVSMLKAIREYGLQRVVTFHNLVEDAQLFAAELPQVAAVAAGGGRPAVMPETADYVSGKMSAEVRKQKLETFRTNADGTCHVLSNVRCLSEGVDVPDIDGIVFVDPRGGEIDIVQAMGRALRKHDNKKYGVIIVSVFVGKGQAASEAIENSSFKHLVDVLNALRAHDMEFAAALDTMRQRQATGEKEEFAGDVDPFTKIKFDLKGVPGLDQVLRPFLLESLTDSFQEGLGYLKVYAAEHGHCRVPRRNVTTDGFKLGDWTQNRRRDRKAGRLPPERIAALDELGFEWDVLAADFQEKLGYIKDFKEEHGHCRVPIGYKTPDGYALGKRVSHFRDNRKAGIIRTLYVAALDELGFEWDVLAADFQEKLIYLKAYKEEHGHCQVPASYKTPDGFRLGQDVAALRHSKRVGSLTSEKIAALDGLGFKWEVKRYETTNAKIVALIRAFWEEHGHCKVPMGYKSPDGYGLYGGVTALRVNRRRGIFSLSSGEIAELNQMGFEWEPNPYEVAYPRVVERIKAFWEKHGHCQVPGNNRALYETTRRIRKWRNAGVLPEEMIATLDELGFVWEPSEKQKDAAPTLPLPDLADRLKNEEQSDDLPELMAQHGCDPEESRALIQAGNFDDALRLLEDATGESLRRNRP